MPETTYRISELTAIDTINNGDLVEVSTVDSNSESGYASRKASMTDLGNKLNNSIEYSTDLETTDKTIIGAINEIAQGGGGSADITSEIDTPAPVMTFNDGGDNIPLKSLVTEIDPSQDGVTSCVVTRTGENIFGGSKLLSNFQIAVPDCVVDTTNKTIYFNSSDTQASPIVSGIFKENTQYSFIITGIRAGGSGSSKVANLRIYYTDGTRDDFTFNQREVKDTFVFVSAEGKTVQDFRKANASGNTTLYYDECGIFEGVKIVSDFASYIGNDYTIALGETLTQGGTLEAVSGLLTRTDMTTKQLTGANISTLSGLNNVYTDCGDIQEIEYYNNKADDIARMIELMPKDNYSTDEKIVGTWIDGRPIYEKTVYDAGGVTGDFTIPHGITNIDRVLSYTGTVKDTRFSEYGDIWVLPRIAMVSLGIDSVTNTAIKITNPQAFTNRLIDWYITIRYVKT